MTIIRNEQHGLVLVVFHREGVEVEQLRPKVAAESLTSGVEREEACTQSGQRLHESKSGQS